MNWVKTQGLLHCPMMMMLGKMCAKNALEFGHPSCIRLDNKMLQRLSMRIIYHQWFDSLIRVYLQVHSHLIFSWIVWSSIFLEPSRSLRFIAISQTPSCERMNAGTYWTQLAYHVLHTKTDAFAVVWCMRVEEKYPIRTKNLTDWTAQAKFMKDWRR